MRCLHREALARGGGLAGGRRAILCRAAFAVDGAWNIVRSNCAASFLADGVSQALLVPPMNVYRISLHPDGMRARVSDFDAYAAAMVSQLRRDANASRRADLIALLREVEGNNACRPQGLEPQDALKAFAVKRWTPGRLALGDVDATGGLSDRWIVVAGIAEPCGRRTRHCDAIALVFERDAIL